MGSCICVVVSRVLFEFPASLIMGAIAEASSMYAAFIVISCVSFLGCIFWILAWSLAAKNSKYIVVPVDEKSQVDTGLPIES